MELLICRLSRTDKILFLHRHKSSITTYGTGFSDNQNLLLQSIPCKYQIEWMLNEEKMVEFEVQFFQTDVLDVILMHLFFY